MKFEIEIKRKEKKEGKEFPSWNINLSIFHFSTKFQNSKKIYQKTLSDCLHESFRSTKEADEKEGEGKKKARMKRVDRRRAFLPGCYRSIKQTSDFPSSSSSLRSRSLSRNFAYIRGEKVEDRFKHNIRPSKRAKSAPFPETRFFLFEHRSKFDNDSRRKRERRKKDSKRIS